MYSLDGKYVPVRFNEYMSVQFITQSTPTPPPHHHTTHSPHRNDVIRKDGEVSCSHVQRPVSHQLEVGSRVNKSEENSTRDSLSCWS